MSMKREAQHGESQTISRREASKGHGRAGRELQSFRPARLVAGAVGAERGPRRSREATSLDSWLAVGRGRHGHRVHQQSGFGHGRGNRAGSDRRRRTRRAIQPIHMDTGDTSKTIDQGITAGSRTIERAGPQLRQAAAAARQELLKLASATPRRAGRTAHRDRWSRQRRRQSGEKISYARSGWRQALQRENHRHGHRLGLESGAGCSGQGSQRLQDCGHFGAARRSAAEIHRRNSPTCRTSAFRACCMAAWCARRRSTASPQALTKSSIKNIAGVVKVVQEGSFVGVVAQTEWAAIQAAKALKVTWSTPETQMPANAEAVYDYLKNTKSFARSAGDEPRKPGRGPRASQQDLRSHLPLALSDAWHARRLPAPSRTCRGTRPPSGPLAGNLRHAQARVRPAGPAGEQYSGDLSRSRRLLRPAGHRRCCRRCRGDVPRGGQAGARAMDARGRTRLGAQRPGATAHRARGRRRERQSHRLGFSRPQLSLDRSERIPLVASRQIGLQGRRAGPSNGTGGGGETYTFENQKIVAAAIPWVQPDPTPLRTSPLRAPGDLARMFASESFMDELAAAQGVDRLQFRLRYAAPNKRATDALTAVGKLANWQERPSPAPASSGNIAAGRGIAVSAPLQHHGRGIAEVEVDKSSGEVTVKKVARRARLRLDHQSRRLKNQIEGNVIQGTSRALMEEVNFDASGIKNLDWASYPILRLREDPAVSRSC